MEPFLTHAIEYENALGESKAKDALAVLMREYPGYSWKVDVKGGVLFVRLLDAQLRSRRANWGMAKKLSAMDHDAAVFEKELKFMAGEFLERANLRRAWNQGEQIKRLEGLPEAMQPEHDLWLPTTSH